MRSLNDFQSPQDVFKTPTRLPSFFDQNLVDPSRVVKVFEEDPQAHIRVFYYQYLKLCFEVNNSNSEALVQKIEELINNPTFQFIFYQEDDPNIFNDNQAKRLISQFFGVLSSGEITVLEAINTYPIMDTIMVHFFRTLMILMDKAESLDNFIPRDELLSFLCSFFGIEVQLHDACIKYVDTDVFVFDQSERIVYMAYINYTEEGESQPTYQTEESKKLQQSEGNAFAPVITVSNAAPPGQASGRAPSSSIGGGKESYIASEFYDYTQDEVVGGGLANKGTTLKGSGHFINPVASSDVHQAITTIEEPKKVTSNFSQEKIYQQTSKTTAIDTKQTSYQSDYTSKINGTQDYTSKLVNKEIVEAPKTTPTVTPIIPSNQTYQPPIKSGSTAYQNSFEANIPTKDYSAITQNNQYATKTNQYTNQYTTQYISSQTNQYVPPPPPPQVNQYVPPPPQVNQYVPPPPPPQVNQYVSSPQVNQYVPPPQISSTNQYTNQYSSSQSYKPNEPAVISPQKPTSYDSGQAKDMFYAPKESPLYSPKIESQSNITGSKVGVGAGNVTSGVAPSKKKVFGLNVSQEFTNSLTIKSMAQPYKTNVVNIKNRARNFRASLANYIK